MAKQSPDRRAVLEMLAKAAAVGQFAGFSRWSFAYAQPQPDSHAAAAAEYQPRFFTPAEYQTIATLTEIIIPKDESPGAQEAGVSEFIDFLAAHGEPDLQPMRAGLERLNARATGGSFIRLDPEAQATLLRSMQSDPFFKLIRRYTVMGYYTSRVGLVELDFPGLKMYSQSPECPHKDDPEHRHLPPPRY